MRTLLAVVVLQTACVSSSIELNEETRDAGPREDAGADAVLRDAVVQDAGPPTQADSGCPESAAPALDTCYDGCKLIEPMWNPRTCGFDCAPIDASCVECDEGAFCRVGFECCDGPQCGLVARNELGAEELCGFEDVPFEYDAACIADVCEVVDFTSCDPGDGCVLIDTEEEACGGGLSVNEEYIAEYIESFCEIEGPVPECCLTIRDFLVDGQCNEETRLCDSRF